MEDTNKVSSEWKEVRLGELCNVKGGKRLPKGEKLQSFPTSHPYIRIRDLNNSKNIEVDSSYEYITKNVHDKISRYITNEGDILISIVGTIGLIAKVGKSLDGANLTENCVKLIDLKEISVEFLYYFLTSCYGKNEIDKGIVGAVQAKLPIKNIKDISIKLPPLHEQEKIASILKSLDDKIELNNQMNQTLEEMAQTIFKEWFVEFNFLNEDGVPYKDNKGEMIESELGMIPEGWRVGKIHEIVDVNPRMILKKGDIAKYADMKALSETQSIISGVIERNFTGSGTKFINRDTLMARITPCLENGKTGFVNFLEDNEVAWGSTEFNVLRSKKGIAKGFTYFLARNKDFRDYAIANMNGSSGRQRISGKILELYKMPIPNEKIMNKFGEIITSFMEQIKKNGEENQTLTNTRDILMPKLMSGEVRV